MAFLPISSSGGLLLEADFVQERVRAIRATNSAPFWVVLRLRDNTGLVVRREEFAPNSTRSVSLTAAELQLVTERVVTEDGTTFSAVNLPAGWRLSIAHLSEGQLPETVT